MNLKSLKYILVIIIFLPVFGCYIQAQNDIDKTPVKTRILFVFDASRSMSGKWHDESKYNIARKTLANILDSIKNIDNIEVALRVYGHTKNFPPQNCNDTRLEVPFSSGNISQINHRLKQLSPRGTSPIANSLLKCKDDFPSCDNCRNIVVLITDGIEECGGDICEISASLQEQGIILRPFIIGIGQDTHEAYDCAGEYFNAASKEQFTRALNVIITKVLSTTSLQVNLLDNYQRPSVSNVNLSFINKQTENVEYNIVHTLNSKGIPDTLYIDHLNKYRLEVNTIPKKIIDPVTLIEGKHTTVSVSCPQGSLKVALQGATNANINPAIIVKLPNSNDILNVQYLNQEINYINGKYDIDILTLPIIKLKNIDIEADNLTNIQIENPGIAVIQKSIMGYGSIYRLENNIQDWVINFGSNTNTTESIYLQPGNYRIVFRSKYSFQSVTTVEKDFEITSEKTTRIKL